MSALGSADLQNSARQNLLSQLEKPQEQSVLLPFFGERRFDEELNLSNEIFEESIFGFFKDKNLTPLSQLIATPAFPTPHLLAQFASKADTDYKVRETDAQYESRLDLPDGWKLLTTASNISRKNGYFGAAYWHPEHQHVVIAHRGTDPKNLGALSTDLSGVIFKIYVPQMSSASTFAHKVVEVLQEVNRKNGVCFQLFFTGHSLGGWLAQVTTFTTKYLTREKKLFQKSYDNDCFHPHTVVFESPGCKSMLSEMTNTFDVSNEGRSTDIEHLDITSYLSAPNLINTYNSHLGTVYRVVIDTSDMGWWDRNTLEYTFATHDKNKIVQALDPATGQKPKDGQGQLNVEVVVDWPISAGLKGAKTYVKFFERANHSNNYHPDTKDMPSQHLYYNPIRYQTKPYVEGENSVSIFSEKEQEFLQCYCWLREWPEFFNPKELFSVMENEEAQKQAEEILQNYEIEKDKIRCTDVSSLQALIPYVKRLLQLFPEIKEKAKHALSSDDVTNRVYQFETMRCIKRIDRSPLEIDVNMTSFKSDGFDFRNFLKIEQQKVLQLEVKDADEWTGLVKVYQFLQKSGFLSEVPHTILKLKNFLILNQFMDFRTLMLSTGTQYLLLITCECNGLLDKETEDQIRNLFVTIKEKENIKIILITRSEVMAVSSLGYIGRRIFGKGFVSGEVELKWNDLTRSSQENLLKKSVIFQGVKLSLNELMSAESPVAEFLPIGALMEEKELKVADPVPISNDYNENYYIGRTFRHAKAIKQEIFKDEKVEEKKVFLANNEEDFKKLCKLNPKCNVHWLEKDESVELLWKQSQGSLETLRRYIDKESSHIYKADDLDELFEQTQHQKLMLISDIAGMGKSTVLTYLSNQIKKKFSDKWVVRIDLNDHIPALKTLQTGKIRMKEAIEFVAKKLLKLDGFELE
jgi:hypothetical protein